MFFKKNKKFVIRYKGVDYPASEKDSVLESMLKHKSGYKYNCGAGVCGQCRFTLVSGQVEISSGATLLACRTYPSSNIEIVQ